MNLFERLRACVHRASIAGVAAALLLATGTSARAAGDAPAPAGCPALLNHSYERLQGGQTQSLCDYRGKVVLVVNTASYCGYTYQYEGLEALYRKYKDRGLVVVGFPSNDFGSQEPGTNKEIAEFCRSTYGVEFPMFEKSTVKGVATNPIYAELAARTGQRPQWNFHKYLIDRRGEQVLSYKSDVEPGSRDFVRQVERWLAEPAPPAAPGASKAVPPA
jgi:glutathione peroxidase